MAKVTYTYWQHFSQYTEEIDSLVDALKRASYAEDNASSSVESITLANGKVLDDSMIYQYYKRHQELERHGARRERARLVALWTETTRPITWKEASMIIRRMRWKPSICVSRGISYLVANIWGKEQRIVSVKQLRVMTPAEFWQRLRHLDPYRAAQVERNIF